MVNIFRIAQLSWVLKLNALQDSKEAQIPLLLPINLLEVLGFDIKLGNIICIIEFVVIALVFCIWSFNFLFLTFKITANAGNI